MNIWRSILIFLGFKKSYNFILFFIFAGGLLGFTLARLQFLDIGGRYVNGTGPGEWFYQDAGFRRVGITLHLGTILPCGILVIFQFIPSIRYRVILFHRINGYIIITLFLISNAGALMITRHAFGGGVEIQLAIGLLVLMSTVSVGIAYYNIRRLQIEQHRDHPPLARNHHANCLAYPMCSPPPNGSEPLPGYKPVAIVHPDKNIRDPARIGANLHVSFGLAVWLAMAMHIIGVEIYLQLTPRENQRLRMVSYKRQKEAGYENPGSAGLVVQKIGDAELWLPSVEIDQTELTEVLK
ncbi:uncharacterized protein PADG_08161 [Paracoccidioides brasiliensis Pb18]|uniref:Uncharacterized protein n=1 Tax=Paracoccidioides brasiliensis (strain Pb18) TaxID=502780 RepID=C1GM75_PARBD|nr:uncharacterized protein PADG_08161 [Paracoccidioides brasiliensis Pb18]EEH43541.2 hypothetical protein PADG_08161 [Paracoccidioides brasiliensis Pb18]